MMRKMMLLPILPVDRCQDFIKENELHNKDENACDFEEEDVFKYF